MFVLIAGEPNCRLESVIRAMAAKLLVARRPVVTRVWFDLDTGLAAAGGSAGTLPEDVFDRQPYVDEDMCFVADGRLSNRVEIAQRLGLSTAEQSQMAESEILYHAFRRWGDQSAKWLSGSYSFCAVDRRTRRVLATTDHVAGSSVFYSIGAKSLILSNQMGAMLAHAEVNSAPDITPLALLVTSRMMRERTSVTSVHVLKGGCSLSYEDGEVSTRRWWNPLDVEPIRYRHSDQYVEHARELFQKAVAAHLRSPGQISIMMSGGLDSTLVAAFAATQARALGREVTSYTSVPEPGAAALQRLNWDLNEIAESQAVVALHPNMRHVLITPDGRTALDYLPRIHAISHTVPAAITNLVWLESINNQAQQAGGRILLTGDNGNAGISLTADAVFGTLFADSRLLTALRLARHDAAYGGSELWRVLAREVRFHRDRHWLVPRAPGVGLSLLQPEVAAAVRGFSEQTFGAIRSVSQRAKFITASKPFWKPDSMAQSGLDHLDPTADKRLIEALLSFPIEAFMAGGLARGMARQMGRGIVPDSVRLRRRRGEQSPEYAGLMQLHSSTYRAALVSLNDSPRCRSTFKLKQANTMLDRLCVGVPNPQDAATLASLINVGLFLLGKGH